MLLLLNCLCLAPAQREGRSLRPVQSHGVGPGHRPKEHGDQPKQKQRTAGTLLHFCRQRQEALQTVPAQQKGAQHVQNSNVIRF